MIKKERPKKIYPEHVIQRAKELHAEGKSNFYIARHFRMSYDVVKSWFPVVEPHPQSAEALQANYKKHLLKIKENLFLIKQMYAHGASLPQIASAIDVPYNSFKTFWYKNLKLRRRKIINLDGTMIGQSQIKYVLAFNRVVMLLRDGKRLPEIANEIGIPVRSIQDYCPQTLKLYRQKNTKKLAVVEKEKPLWFKKIETFLNESTKMRRSCS